MLNIRYHYLGLCLKGDLLLLATDFEIMAMEVEDRFCDNSNAMRLMAWHLAHEGGAKTYYYLWRASRAIKRHLAVIALNNVILIPTLIHGKQYLLCSHYHLSTRNLALFSACRNTTVS